ncbi:DUF2452 domain-containing protein [Dokdonia sp. Dokd-P16]|uniref:DUF2452 domain-containing protein n=1 Tax=Dokdonia sp. Dokd-P16 TaxID=2173169 RepID=UPI000D548770|nr:DUF2452 domain-containing protein [Dokdonia sp. Dokd-P16]AWH73564.1 DUF2452 domain-containing protein [Dokdonia sp. Dokd-P16]
MTKKKPDQVVYNEEKGKYDAALTPYATNLGAPAIVTDDVTTWKNSNISKVNHQFKTEYEELKAQYEVMMKKFEYNNLIYAAKFSFEPIVGAIYHLYRSKSGEPFLSLISPDECNWDFAGTFELKADKIWNRLDTPKEEEEENEK